MRLHTTVRQRQPRQTDAEHLKWIRTLSCLVSGTTREVEAAHIRFSDGLLGKRLTGKGERPDDRWTVPLARDQHADQHRHGERRWWELKGIDPLAVAAELYAVSGDTEAAERILSKARTCNK